MNDKINQLINQYNGKKGIGDTDANKGQCVGLISVWLDNLGVNNPHLYGNAIDLLNNADKKRFDVIYNTPTGIPNVGDVITFGSPYGKAIANGKTIYYGHTGIIVKADVNKFTLFEQNSPLGSPCKITDYKNYASVIGWLHPKSQPINWDDKVNKMKNALNAGGTSQDRATNADKIFHS